MAAGQAREWWDDHVESGEIDHKDPKELDDGTQEHVVFLSEQDLITIHEALRRHFIALKSNRYATLHATYNIRLAMRNVLSEFYDEQEDDEDE